MNKQKEITLRKNDERERNTGKTKPQNITEGSEKEICMGCNKYPANIRLDEDVFRLRLQKASSRRIDQDENVCLSLTSSEDVFKTSWSRPIYSSWSYVFRRL